MKEEEERFDPTERAAVFEIIKDAISERSMASFNNAIHGISRQFGKVDLSEIDTMLRDDLGTPVYLLAMPVSELADTVSLLPHSGDHEYPYFVFSCIGKPEITRWLGQLNITREENAQRLKNTGIANVKPNTPTFRRLTAPRN